jgi:hypothetical protein
MRKLKQSAASLANVHLTRDGNTTTFHVHGGGLVISRMINEFGIAKMVTQAIEEAFKARHSPGSSSSPSTWPASQDEQTLGVGTACFGGHWSLQRVLAKPSR